MLSRGQGEEKGSLPSRPGECLGPHPGHHPARPSSPQVWPDFVQTRPRWVTVRATGSEPPSPFSRTSCPPLLRHAWSRGGFCKHQHTGTAAWGGLGKGARMLLRRRQPLPIPAGSQCRGSPLAGALAPLRRIPGAPMEPGGTGHNGTPAQEPSRNSSPNCSSAEG